ncbi:MAG: phosphatidate cytidylyltransferase [Chromatiales bacterium]|nr:phosphatidate cytidylyltransferase [Chromatiales bacterium]
MPKRLLTAAFLIPLVVCGLFCALPTRWFVLATGAFILLAVWEWAGLIRATHRSLSTVLVLHRASRRAGVCHVVTAQAEVPLLYYVTADGGAVVVDRDRVVVRAVSLGATWACVQIHVVAAGIADRLGWPWLICTAATNTGRNCALFICVLMWVADSWRRISPANLSANTSSRRTSSPGKTWEGFAGGMLGSALLAVIAGQWWLGLNGDRLIMFVALVLLCAAISVVGDLFFSLLKRQPTSERHRRRCFPGHGGILDRIDSPACGRAGRFCSCLSLMAERMSAAPRIGITVSRRDRFYRPQYAGRDRAPRRTVQGRCPHRAPRCRTACCEQCRTCTNRVMP